MTEQSQTGRLFTEVYYPRTELIKDDPRARKRIAAVFSELTDKSGSFQIAKAIKLRLGIEVPHGEGAMGIYYRWDEYFNNIEIRDLLDSITVIHSALSNYNKEKWRKLIQVVFRQQALEYELDSACGVRMFVDEEFSRAQAVVLRLLASERHKVALGHFKEFEICMYGRNTDFRGAIRHLFETLEDVFKRICNGKESRLDPNSAKRGLTSKLQTLYFKEELNALIQLVSGFSNWVTAAQQYRHAAGGIEIPAPGRSSAVLMASVGFGYLRWLIEFDVALIAAESHDPSST